MNPNPVLQKLGLSAQDRAVIFHTDDIGMCQASVAAYADLWSYGLISSGAVMVPCPWFLEAAKMAVETPAMDLGVHITLTSEWKTYRWGPISTRDPQSGMLDPQGYFYHRAPEAREHGDPAAVRLEMKAQIERALAAGMAPTHIDTHMGTVASPKFMPAYIEMAFSYHLPPMIFRLDEAGWRAAGLDAETAVLATQMVSQVEESGMPLLDTLSGLPLDTPDQRLERARAILADLKPGVTHFILHPSKDTPELRAITPDWRCRVADYELFQSEGLRKVVQELGIQVIGYSHLKQLISA